MTTPPAFRLAEQRYDEAIDLATITTHPDNPNMGAPPGLIEESMGEHGFYGGILVQESTRFILVGNHRYEEALAAGATHLPGWWYTGTDEQARKIMAVDNRSSRLGTDDTARLLALLKPMSSLTGTGYDEKALLALMHGQGERGGPDGPSMADRFMVPPFDVLDTRQGWWRARKQHWLSLGIQSELGRLGGKDADKAMSHARADPGYYARKAEAEALLGRPLSAAEFDADWYTAPTKGVGTGISVFDPVLCELVYRWFAPPGGLVVDPFAGGSVRGLVAGACGRRYLGVDLSGPQVAANEAQAAAFTERDLMDAGAARWQQGDAAEHPWTSGTADLLFTCPPYYDLERYSDNPADLSTMAEGDFDRAYATILAHAASALKRDRFAVVVVGDARDPSGRLRDLRGATVRAMERAGLVMASGAVLVTPVGSVRIAASRVFTATRTLSRVHQDVLVFCKGDRGKAALACGPVELPDIPADPSDVIERPTPPAAPGQPDWARGVPVASLQVVTALWKAHDGDLPLGAFMRVKEATVADWHAAGKLHAWAADGQVVAAMAAHRTKRPTRVEDFRGQAMADIPAGALVVDRMAGDGGVLAAEVAKLDPAPWVWAWQENPADRHVVAALGLAWAGTKIRASSELIGLWGPHGDGLDGIDAWGLVRMGVEYDPAALLAEVQAAEPGWASHYASYNQRGTWQAVALRGYGGRHDFIQKPAEMSRKWKAEHPEEMGWGLADSPLYDSLPQVRAAIDAIPGVKHRVRLMRLAPGNGELTRHSDITDPDAGTAPGKLLRLHLPLVTNTKVVFRSWTPMGRQQSAHMAAGECWYLDTRKPHTARNDGPTERIHVVADVESCPALLALAGAPARAAKLDLAYQPGGLDWVPWHLEAANGEEHPNGRGNGNSGWDGN